MEKPQHLLNNQIRANKIMLLDAEGEKLGEVSYQDAMKKAYDESLDLVQVGMNKDVAICKILNYSAWLYHEKKRKDKQDFESRSQDLKSMNFRPGIGDNDFMVKMKKITGFLEENHRVKIIIKLKNREFTMKAVNDALVQKITDSLKDNAGLDSKISWSPKEINFMIKPEKKVAPKVKM